MSAIVGPRHQTLTNRNTKSHSPIKRKKVKEPEQYKQFEEVLEQVNPFGVYQIFAGLCIVFAQIEWSGNFSFVSIIGSIEPDWVCTVANGSVLIVERPMNEKKCQQLLDCVQWNANNASSEFTSIVSTFRLVCDDADKVQLIQIVQASALFVGAIVGGHLGDWFGRQFGFYICALSIAITSCMTIASTNWIMFAMLQLCNGFLYGIVEVMSITLLMEYTNNKYRIILNACFQTNVANMVLALIAYLTNHWQMYFVFLNLVTLPIAMAFMLLHESPRWLLVKGKINEACNVLNDLSDNRWNGTAVTFTPNCLALIPHEQKKTFYNLYHLFNHRRFAKQTLMQILSMITYAVVFVCYLEVICNFKGNSIGIAALDGGVRLIVLIVIILLDFQYKNFTRRLQFLLSLILIGVCLAIAIALTIAGFDYDSTLVTITIMGSAMLADSIFWMNIVQVTTQRYPTVIRCIAFGCVHAAKHLGTILGIVILHPWLKSRFPVGAYIFLLALVIVTLVVGIIFQPDTKGKALLDTIEEVDYTRVENVLPITLQRMAAIHRVMQSELHRILKKEKREEWAQWTRHLEAREEEGRQVSTKI